MREMKDSGIEWIGEIPNSWGLKRLQYSIDEINIKNFPVKTEQVLSLVKDKGVMLYEDKGNQGNKAKEDVTEYKVAFPNTLIVNSMNILIGSVGISNYLGCVSPVYYVFKETENSDLRFINYIFNTREFQSELRRYANGILEIRLRVSSSDIFKRKIALPTKEEQSRIASFLDSKCSEIDSLHSDIEEEIETLKEYKKSVITEAVTKGLNPDVKMKDSGIEWIGKIPNDWKVIDIKYLVKKAITDGTHQTPIYDNEINGSPFLSSKDVTSGHIDWSNIKYITQSLHEKLQKEVKPQKNDILLAKNGTTGVAAIVEDDTVFDIYVTLALIRVKEKIVLPKYMLYVINSNICKEQFNEHLIGIGVPNLHLNIINNVSVLIPDSLNEQQQIADYLDTKCSEIDSIIESKQQQLETLEQYKKSLIYEYVTGKKEVPYNA